MTGTAFVQPVAGHSSISSYLIVRDAENHWFLWVGSDEKGLTEIPESTVSWMRGRPEIVDFPLPRFWFEASSLPLAEHTTRSRSI